jgi:hypothetical protein
LVVKASSRNPGIAESIATRSGSSRRERQLATDERLTAGQADVADTHVDEHAHESLELLEAQQLRAFQPAHALCGHAVAAAETAAVSHREAQIADRASVAVKQLRALRDNATIARWASRLCWLEAPDAGSAARSPPPCSPAVR